MDYTVRYEDQDSLERATEEKTREYECIKKPVLGETKFEVIPVVIGANEAIPRTTLRSHKRLSISERKTLLTIAMTALRCSIEITNRFLDNLVVVAK